MKWIKKAPSFLGKVFVTFWNLISIYSLFWVVQCALKTNRELFENPWSIPVAPQIQNFVSAIVSNNLGRNFLNSIIVVACSVVALTILCAPTAYVLSRANFIGKKSLTNGFRLGMAVPYQLLLVPLYFMMFRLKLINSYAGLILVYVTLQTPFTIYMMSGFFKTLPSALEEAATIDGCTPIKAFWHVMLPLGRPGLITAGIFNFIGLWNEYMIALVFMGDSSKFTISVGLSALQTSMKYTGNWVVLFAGIVLVVFPTLFVYLFLSKYILEGLTMGAVKE